MTNSTIPTASDEQITAILSMAAADCLSPIDETGIRLTWEQADRLGDMYCDWLARRYGLRCETDSDGITYYPASETEVAS